MNITPTTIGNANRMGTKIVVFDTEKKKAVLVFKSLYLAANYLFGHRILKEADRNNFISLINRCNDKKKKEEKNIFSTPLTYRVADEKYQEILGDNDMVVIDGNYKNETYEAKKEIEKPRYNEYANESKIKIGDSVTIKFGRYAGKVVSVLDITDKSKTTPGLKYYVVDINGQKHNYKANILEL